MDDAPNAGASRRSLPFSYAFAKRWHLVSFAIAIVAWLVYGYASDIAKGFFDIYTLIAYYIPIAYGPAAIALSVLFWIDKTYLRQGIEFVGKINKTLVISCLFAVLSVYLSGHGLAWLMGYPREPFMQDLYQYQSTTTQLVVFLVSLLILPPIVEEMLYRHFFLSVIPFKRNAWLAVLAVVVPAVAFTLVHRQYEYWTTYATLFGFAVVSGVARVMSRGMLLSILLHVFAIGVALLLNEIVA
ncbi:CPBP family glutamic-type intramembrane protease [Chromohalobacter sp. 11-W]|uniref:CPBP family glutamic-type intramembrane protease n=1 Tax=Chromohalobacter sp. 11-W TaxID=2994061 RepID=UPI0024691DC0|nr:CPBP family glutamic-type intramembrane protease [Chromohalobacter sp. 11-W]